MREGIYNGLKESCILCLAEPTIFYLTMVFYIHPGGVLERGSSSEDQNRLIVKGNIMANSESPVTSPATTDIPSSTGKYSKVPSLPPFPYQPPYKMV